MGSTPRRLHYVSASYLGGFTSEGGRDGHLHVLDTTTGAWRPSRPNNEAHERDAFRLESPAPDPLALENWFRRIEDAALPVIAAIRSSATMPERHERSALIAFMAIHSLRVPGHMQAMGDGLHRLGRTMAWFGAENQEQRNAIEDDAFEFGLVQNSRMDMMLAPFTPVVRSLRQRSWTVLVARADAPEFVTSDHPVTPVYDHAGSGWMPAPQVGMGGTEVTFPIGRRHALLGVWRDARASLDVGEDVVGTVNLRTLKRATRWVYGASNDFAVRSARGGVIGVRAHLAGPAAQPRRRLDAG